MYLQLFFFYTTPRKQDYHNQQKDSKLPQILGNIHLLFLLL